MREVAMRDLKAMKRCWTWSWDFRDNQDTLCQIRLAECHRFWEDSCLYISLSDLLLCVTFHLKSTTSTSITICQHTGPYTQRIPGIGISQQCCDSSRPERWREDTENETNSIESSKPTYNQCLMVHPLASFDSPLVWCGNVRIRRIAHVRIGRLIRPEISRRPYSSLSHNRTSS